MDIECVNIIQFFSYLFEIRFFPLFDLECYSVSAAAIHFLEFSALFEMASFALDSLGLQGLNKKYFENHLEFH